MADRFVIVRSLIVESLLIGDQRLLIATERTHALNQQSPNPQSTRNRYSPIKDHQFTIQYTPTVVVDAKALYGLTPLTPSHGYFSSGGSLSPSSRSRNPGMKNSLVRVVSFTRPVCP